MCGGWTLYGDTTMVVSLIVVLAEASRNVFAELPSSSELRWTLVSRDQGGLVGVCLVRVGRMEECVINSVTVDRNGERGGD